MPRSLNWARRFLSKCCQMTVGFGGTTNVKYTDWGDDYTGNHYYATTTEIKWDQPTITRPRTKTGG